MSQHSSLTLERWSRFAPGTQILHIAAEMQRGLELLGRSDHERLRASYERVLALLDLTVAANKKAGLRRELLRWRGVVAENYVSDPPDLPTHRLALRVLLEMHPDSQGQVAALGL
jgi:hypothetical protein